MPVDRRRFLQSIGLWSGSAAVWPLLGGCSGDGLPVDLRTSDTDAPSSSGLPPLDPLAHLLRRTRFATTQADYDDARRLGTADYLDAQLRPPSPLDPVYLEADLRYPITALPPPVNLVAAPVADQATQQLAERTLFLAAYSPQQLFEMTVDFWTNHFNVENVTGELPLHKLFDDREVIRRHSFGRFRELLMASAKSPAMLEYLDSAQNVVGGPNENYARELMELHTLGVDGGYTEADVKEVARCFTGWSISGLTRRFEFLPERHDDGEKWVLGQRIPPGGGVRDGEIVLDLLATHPSTALFIARKLATRFVSDDPPPALVTALAQTFRDTAGDIPSVLRSLFQHEAFAASQDQKFRRPIEFLATLLRQFDPQRLGFDGPLLLQALSRMGQIPHRWFPPDGYPDRRSYWLNTACLLEYWNLAAEVAERRGLFGERQVSSAAARAGSTAARVERLAEALLQRRLRPQDSDQLIVLADALHPATSTAAIEDQCALISGLLLASPYASLR